MMPLWSCMERLRWAAHYHWLNALAAWEWFALVPSGTRSPMRVSSHLIMWICVTLSLVHYCCATLFLIELLICFVALNFVFSVHGSILSLASNASSSYSSVSVGGMQTQVATAQYMVWYGVGCIYV